MDSKIKIFTDYHHGDLYYSLHRLFVERLGFELYRPIGLDWYSQGYWKVADPYPKPLQTVRQYLDINKGGYSSKNLNGGNFLENGIYHIHCPSHEYYQRGITLEAFREIRFDIIMPTFPGHDVPYEKLRNLYQPGAKLVMQMGNAGQFTHLPNVLHSSAYPNPRPGQNCLFYHQEINPNFFSYTPLNVTTKNIYSVVNLAPDLQIYNNYKSLIKEASWKYYGAGCPQGPLSGSRKVSDKMKEANIAWHLKQGVGHSTRGWFSIGRPLVTKMSLHSNAGGDTLSLFEPGVTCVNLEANSVNENCRIIRRLLEPEVGLRWSKRVNRRFRDIVDYDRDEVRIRKFLERLI